MMHNISVVSIIILVLVREIPPVGPPASEVDFFMLSD